MATKTTTTKAKQAKQAKPVTPKQDKTPAVAKAIGLAKYELDRREIKEMMEIAAAADKTPSAKVKALRDLGKNYAHKRTAKRVSDFVAYVSKS
jgi:hypothetical protein